MKDSIGKGQFGSVYKAVDKTTGGTVAVKAVMRKDLQSNWKLAQQILVEVKAMRMVSHPNIVRLNDTIQDSDAMYIIMEYCEGGNLDVLVKDSRCLSEDQSIEYLRQVLQGYKSLLAAHILHRDLKAANIFVKGDRVLIGDFGFAKILNPEQDGGLTSSQIGTPICTAPEIMLHSGRKPYDSKADMWSLGCLFFFMLYGRYPVTPKTRIELKTLILSNTGQNLVFPDEPEVSPLPKELLKRMLEPDSLKRISWQELLDHQIFNDEALLQESMISNRVDFRGKIPSNLPPPPPVMEGSEKPMLEEELKDFLGEIFSRGLQYSTALNSEGVLSGNTVDSTRFVPLKKVTINAKQCPEDDNFVDTVEHGVKSTFRVFMKDRK